MIILVSINHAIAQKAGGEIEDTEIIIEKDKPLTLPKADRYYQPTEISTDQYEPPKVNYSFSEVQFKPGDFQPSLKYKPYTDDQVITSYENYVKAAYGNYGSPLIEGQYLYRQDNHYMKAFAKHLSFSKGPVREKESGFSQDQISLKGHLDGDINFDPFISWQRESYYFYGRDTTYDVLNPFIIDDKIILQHLNLGVTVKLDEINKLSFDITPSFRNSFNKVSGGNKFATETELDLSGLATFHPIEELSFGLGLGAKTLKYESVYQLNRTRLQLNPHVVYQVPKVSLRGGFQFVAATDSINGESKSYIYPDIDVTLNVIKDLTIYGALSGGLNLTSLYTLSEENRYLENALPILNQNNKLMMKGGIKTRIVDQLFLDAALGYGLIDNLPFFIHSLSDSSRFTLVYDSTSTSRTSLTIGLGYFREKFSFNYGINYYGYGLSKLDAPWYKPKGVMNIITTYRPVAPLSIQLTGSLLGGIVAPRPNDGLPKNLPAIFDLGLGMEYKIIDHASILASIQNLTSNNYERYLNYPTRGISFKLGFIYRF